LFVARHLLLALCLTAFLACQVAAFIGVLRARPEGTRRPRRPSDLVWSTLPILVVLLLAARSWLAALDAPWAAAASAASAAAGPESANSER
jgi:hypothetical protein